ncbi:MAG: hypothetical protein A2Z51_10485 [Deltaproteobacteria bacterium RBG_19FT_COMBO_52_11]|nr:MAG: hypothetical protein A2Z51_10485 [Deltaproteobacteria bacterium RBG_19FT_COMBO_52_11]
MFFKIGDFFKKGSEVVREREKLKLDSARSFDRKSFSSSVAPLRQGGRNAPEWVADITGTGTGRF